MEIVTCRNCGSDHLQTFLDLGESALANEMAVVPNQQQDRYPLRAQVCTNCWLAQQGTFVPDDVIYNADYAFYSSTSPDLVKYHATYADLLLERHRPQAERLTVEIACNDGDLLQHFADAKCPVIGVDPAPGPAHNCASRGINTLNRPFGRDTAEWIRNEAGPAGLVIANNVAAHVEDLDDFFIGIRDLMDYNSVAIVSVQYLGDLLVGNQFDHMYHEHRYWYSLTSFADVAHRRGLNVVSVDFTEPQGGSMMITLVRGVQPFGSAHVNAILTSETWLRRAGTYLTLQGRADRIATRVTDALLKLAADGNRIAGYGLPAKATTLLSFLGIQNTELISHIVDTTPWKIGKFAPGTSIPVVSPGEHPDVDVYLLLIWNYLSSVLRRERAFQDAGGRFLVPIPTPVLL